MKTHITAGRGRQKMVHVLQAERSRLLKQLLHIFCNSVKDELRLNLDEFCSVFGKLDIIQNKKQKVLPRSHSKLGGMAGPKNERAPDAIDCSRCVIETISSRGTRVTVGYICLL